MVALVLTALAIMGSPGPATVSLTAAGSAYGVRRSLPYLAGIVVGTWLVLALVATGVTTLLLALPGLHPVLLGASAAYILWLAWHLARAPAARDGDAPVPSARGGLLLGVANPKAWVAIAAVFAGSSLAPLEKTPVLAAIVVAVNATWLAAGASLAPLLRSRAANVGLALLLVVATAVAVVH
jgi:threonine/homoserine/homoserine lactone efflux protein